MSGREKSLPHPRLGTLVVVGVGLATTIAIALLTMGGLSILSGVRAYVGGEGLWSKSQKDAVHWLHRYAETRDESAWRQYLAAIAVPLGDRLAREELQKPKSDYEVVRRGFILGRNHPDDVRNMSWLFRDFQWVPHMKRAIVIWERADAEITALVAAGERLRDAVRRGAPRQAMAPILTEIDAVNARVTPLEDDFSFTLGEVARRARSVVLQGVAAAALLLFLLGAFVVRRLIREVTASEERYRTVTETATDGIVSLDERGRILFANSAAGRILGHPPHGLLGRHFEELLPERFHEGPGSFLRRCFGDGNAAEPASAVRVHARHPKGHEVPLEVSFGETGGGRHRVYTGVLRDVTRKLQSEQQIERLAYHDLLTGLPNRALFHDRLANTLTRARRQDEKVAVMFLDLDEFKTINDSLGHNRGDAVLREIGSRLKSCLRGQDTAARLGGDEFIVFLPQVGETVEVAQVASKILSAIARPMEIDGESLSLTGSIGISVFPTDGVDRETLLSHADTAMYRAKEQGSNTFEFFTPEMNRQLVARREIEQSLSRALERGELTLHYQPIWRTLDERIVGLEALLRWDHTDPNKLFSDEFRAVTQNSPLMLPVGDWVLKTACEQLRQWRRRGLPLERLSVNLPARQLQRKDLVENMDRVLLESDLGPEDVHLEIPETAAMKNVELTMRALAGLKERGIHILMDDFGSGHASIGHLRRFPVDALKIDRNFVEQIDRSASGAAIVRAIVSLAHGIGLSVIAEGVTREGQLDFLKRHACDEFQGHLRSRPLPPEAAAALVSAQNR